MCTWKAAEISLFKWKTLPTFHCDSAHGVPVIYYDFSAAVGTDSFFFFFFSKCNFYEGYKTWMGTKRSKFNDNIQEAMGKRKRQKFLFIIARCGYLMGPQYCSTNELIIELLRSEVKHVGGCERNRKWKVRCEMWDGVYLTASLWTWTC